MLKILRVENWETSKNRHCDKLWDLENFFTDLLVGVQNNKIQSKHGKSDIGSFGEYLNFSQGWKGFFES